MGREAGIFRQKYDLKYNLNLGIKMNIGMPDRYILFIKYASSETSGVFRLHDDKYMLWDDNNYAGYPMISLLCHFFTPNALIEGLQR